MQQSPDSPYVSLCPEIALYRGNELPGNLNYELFCQENLSYTYLLGKVTSLKTGEETVVYKFFYQKNTSYYE